MAEPRDMFVYYSRGDELVAVNMAHVVRVVSNAKTGEVILEVREGATTRQDIAKGEEAKTILRWLGRR